jgi:hypothetical protein
MLHKLERAPVRATLAYQNSSQPKHERQPHLPRRKINRQETRSRRGQARVTQPSRLLKFGFSRLYRAFETGSVVLVECYFSARMKADFFTANALCLRTLS